MMDSLALRPGISRPDPIAPDQRVQLPVLAAGELHEIHADAEDWAAATAFALAMHENGRKKAQKNATFLILPARQLRLSGHCYGEGFADLGMTTDPMVIVQTANARDLLRAGLEAARCPGIAAVVVQSWGALSDYDLTASRRLALAAERSRVAVILLRGDAEPRATAAHSRWAIRSAPSLSLEGDAPGWPAIEAELLRRRGGPAGQSWRLIWDADDGVFREAKQKPAPTMSRAVVSLSGVRTRLTHRGWPSTRRAA